MKVTLNRRAVRALLKSAEVSKELERRANKVRNAAGSADHEVEMWTGRNRARATIRTSTYEGRSKEATGRNLSGSLDAGRG